MVHRKLIDEFDESIQEKLVESNAYIDVVRQFLTDLLTQKVHPKPQRSNTNYTAWITLKKRLKTTSQARPSTSTAAKKWEGCSIWPITTKDTKNWRIYSRSIWPKWKIYSSKVKMKSYRSKNHHGDKNEDRAESGIDTRRQWPHLRTLQLAHDHLQ